MLDTEKQKPLSLEEMAEHFGQCTKTFAKYVKAYQIPHIKLGRAMFFDKAEVVEFLKIRTMEPAEKIRIPEKRMPRSTRPRPKSEFAGFLSTP